MNDSEIFTASYTITEAVNYVKKIYISANSNKAQALSGLQTQTSEQLYAFDKDLNEGAKGDYIYMGYTTTTNKDEAIRNLKIDFGKDASSSFSSGGATTPSWILI